MPVATNTAKVSITACPAPFISQSTSVRRKGRSINMLLPGPKKIPSVFSVRALFIFLLVMPFFLLAQKQEATNKFSINFQHRIGEKLLQEDSIYQNPSGEPFTVRSFKYYISNIVLQDEITGKKQLFAADYFLVDEADSKSKKIEVNTILQQVTSIQFLLGIDSIKNVTGVQTGNLDPAKGMFWTWNTGYVMAKLEGNSPVAKTPGHTFSYHVGGYKQNEKTERLINLILPKPVAINNDNSITIEANISNWFGGTNTIKIAETATCHSPGLLAVKLADNYANMFTIKTP